MPTPNLRGGIPEDPGTYILVLSCVVSARVRIGKSGMLDLRPGYYTYVGSAQGPGGLRARVAHHGRVAARPHWHIDYLRCRTRLIEVWFSAGRAVREHEWAKALAKLQSSRPPMPRFGASDCRCPAHLFRFDRPPSSRTLLRKLRETDGAHPAIGVLEWAAGS